MHVAKCELLTADTCKNVDKLQRNDVEQKKSGTKEHVEYVHLYGVQEAEKTIYSDICFQLRFSKLPSP